MTQNKQERKIPGSAGDYCVPPCEVRKVHNHETDNSNDIKDVANPNARRREVLRLFHEFVFLKRHQVVNLLDCCIHRLDDEQPTQEQRHDDVL